MSFIQHLGVKTTKTKNNLQQQKESNYFFSFSQSSDKQQTNKQVGNHWFKLKNPDTTIVFQSLSFCISIKAIILPRHLERREVIFAGFVIFTSGRMQPDSDH